MKISMGKGDIAVMFCSDREDEKPNGISFVKRNVAYPIAVDVDCDVTDEEIENGTLGHLTFSDPKSIDAVVTQLTRLKKKMVVGESKDELNQRQVLLEAIAANKKILAELNEFSENEGHSNVQVVLAVCSRILQIEKKIEQLEDELKKIDEE